MKKSLADNLSEILRFKERISTKNNQLSILRRFSLMFSEAEDETTFLKKAIPFIKDAIDTEGDLILYLEIDETTRTAIGLPEDELRALYMEIKDLINPEDLPVVVDLVPEEHGDSLSFLLKQGFSKCLICSIHEQSKVMGFLGIPQRGDYTLQEDDAVFIGHLGEIIGMFYKYVNLRRNLHDTTTKIAEQFQDLDAVYSVSKSLGGHLSTDAVLNNALETLLSQDVLNIEAKGGIFLLNEETDKFELRCSRNIGRFLEETEQTIELGYCLCGRVAQTGEMVTSFNCFSDARHDTQFEEMALHGHINLPLKIGQRILGVLFLYLPGNVKPTPRQIDLLQSIANQLSVALENARLYEKVHNLSIHDPLTNLFNRKIFFERLQDEMDRSDRSKKPFSIAMIDVDHFKNINDTYGHPAGDNVLREFAGILKDCVRKIDTVARFGGEEFAILLTDAGMEESVTTMERLKSSIEKYAFSVDEKGNTTSLTASIGISTLCPDDPVDQAAFIKAADAALYRAKDEGRNLVRHS